MNGPWRNLALALATVVAMGAAPEAARAFWFGYSNDTRAPLVIQLSMMVNNQERKNQPRSINPRERNFEPIVQPGVKVVFLTVMDAQQRQVGRFRINFPGRDVFYSIQVDQVATQVNKTTVLQLVEIRLPAPGPAPGAPGGMQAMPGAAPGFPGFPGSMPNPGFMPFPQTPTVPTPGNTTTPIPPKKN